MVANRERRRPRLDVQALERLTDLADYFVPFTIRAISELGIADLLADGPLEVEELARRTETHERSLYRALRLLAAKGVLDEIRERTFALTAMGELLRSDHPLSLREAYREMPEYVFAWLELRHSLRTGEPAFDHVYGTNVWDHLAAQPEVAARFDRAMQAMTRPELLAVSAAYPWRSLRTLVDVGGGNGAFLAGLLGRNRRLKGTLFDLPHVVAHAAPILQAAGVDDRCDVVGGSFFDPLPPGADAYLLKRTLYALGDRDARAVLERVADAMTADSRILLVEPLERPLRGGDARAQILDMLMLVVDGGRIRSEQELAELFADSRLELVRVIETMAFPIVEGRLAS